MAQLTNSSENSLAEAGKLAFLVVIWLSSTAMLTSRYFSKLLFFIKYQGFQ